MANFMDFTTANPSINLILIDESGSMEDHKKQIKTAVREYQKKFWDFPEADSIAVSICFFNDDIEYGEFKSAKKLKDIRYAPRLGTALNYAIVQCSEYLTNYMEEIQKNKKISPIASFIVFSDGMPYGDRYSEEDGNEAIDLLNKLGVNTIFVPFGEAIESGYGEKKGFKIIKKLETGSDAVEFFSEELSQFSIEQSKFHTAIGSKFFSETVNSKSDDSSDYSNLTAQALDKKWWDF